MCAAGPSVTAASVSAADPLTPPQQEQTSLENEELAVPCTKILHLVLKQIVPIRIKALAQAHRHQCRLQSKTQPPPLGCWYQYLAFLL